MSLTGFGFSLLSIPFLNLIMSPKIAVPLVIILGCGLNIILFAECYRQIEIKKVFHLGVGGIIGMPFGAYILSRCSPTILKVFISVIILVVSFVVFLGINKRFQRERLASLVIGFISGGLKGSVGMPGGPVILFGLNQSWNKEKFRATIIAYFTFLSLIALPIFFKFELFTITIQKLSLITLPIAVLGFIGGRRLRNRVSLRIFRRIALVLIIFTGISGLISTLWNVFR